MSCGSQVFEFLVLSPREESGNFAVTRQHFLT